MHYYKLFRFQEDVVGCTEAVHVHVGVLSRKLLILRLILLKYNYKCIHQA